MTVDSMTELYQSRSPESTLEFGGKIGRGLESGDVVLLYGGLGTGKTLLTKGILNALDFDVDEVTSPSFTLVNLYKTGTVDVYHIDLWRLESDDDSPTIVGLEEIIDKDRAVTIIEWADRLADFQFPNRTIRVSMNGYGDDQRTIKVATGG